MKPSTLTFVFFIPAIIAAEWEEFIDVNWECTSDKECNAEGSSCVDFRCQCPSEWIFNSNLTRCLEVANSYGSNCEETLQCSLKLLSGAVCDNNKCACSEGYHYIHGRCHRSSALGEDCENDDDCFVNAEYGAASCVKGSCACSEGYYRREYRTCRRIAKKGENCIINQDCKDKNTFCSNGICAANDVTLKIEKQSEIPVTSYEANTRSLVGDFCTSNADCSSLGKSSCGPEKRCVCDRAHFPSPDKDYCIPELGETCEENDKIYIQNSGCRNGRWNCVNNMAIARNNQACKKTTKIYRGSCLQHEQCHLFGPDGYCNSKKCECLENSRFLESEMFCWTKKKVNESCVNDRDCDSGDAPGQIYCSHNICTMGIGGLCQLDEDCRVSHSSCQEGSCKCAEDFVSTSLGTCEPKLSLGKECKFDVQCSSVLENSVCKNSTSENTEEVKTVCDCADDFYFRFDKCLPRRVLGGACKQLGECYEESGRSICRKGFCTCDWGFEALNETACVPARLIPRKPTTDGAATLTSLGWLTTTISVILILAK